jgi:hypothetical protein
MPKPRPSMMKRQREQAKRDKKAMKAERRAQRKDESANSPETGNDIDIETENLIQ